MKKKQSVDKGQSSIFDFGNDLLTKEEKLELIQISQNRLEDVQNIQIEEKDDENNKDLSNLRSEQIFINDHIYNNIFSSLCHFPNNLFNQCIFEIRQAFFKSNKKYGWFKKKTWYNQLDKKFKTEKNENYYNIGAQTAQQIIKKATDTWDANEEAREDYSKHPDKRKDYTGQPGIPYYREKGGEFNLIFTNQQCEIEKKDIFDETSINDPRLRWIKKHVLTFPDHLNIKPIETRLSNTTDLREVRIVPRGIGYKVEIVYKKVINEIEKIKSNLNKNYIIGIDLGQENTVTIANSIGLRPIIVKGGILKSLNQWYNKIRSELYSVYSRQQSATEAVNQPKPITPADNCYRQQKFDPKKKGQKGQGQKIKIGESLKIQSQNRFNRIKDIFHKISRFIVEYCIENKIGTIVIGRNQGWKQNINIGKRNNQNFVSIPFYLLIRLLKYKAEEIGIQFIEVDESHTSKCSFPDGEEIRHHDKYIGKRIHRGLFRTGLGRRINADVNAAYNIIRKVFPNAFGHGTVGEVLHPERLSIKDLLSNVKVNQVVSLR